MSGNGTKVELLGKPQEDWNVAMIDTGVWRNLESGYGRSATM